MKKLTLIFLILTVTGLGLSAALSRNYNQKGFPQDLFDHYAHKVVGPIKKINETEEFNLNEFDNVKIDINSSDVVFKHHDGTKLKVTIKGEVRTHGEIESIIARSINHKELILEVKVNTTVKKKIAGIDIHIDDDLNIEVALPKSFDKPLTIDAGSSDLEFINTKLSKITLDIGSGDIQIKDALINSFNAEVGSGDIDISNSEIKNIDLDIASGDISLTELAADQVNIEVSSGDSQITGDIKSIEMSSSSGDIKILNRHLQPEMKITISSGDISLKLNNEAAFNLTASTSSGEVTTDLTKTDEDTKSITHKKGDSENKVSISTSSGDIKID